MKLITSLSALFLVALVLISCQKESFEINASQFTPEEDKIIKQYLNLPEQTLDYTVQFPDYHFRNQLLVDEHKATLGRVIFYDKNLSKDKSISCASCHKQEIAFSDDVAFSEGIEGRRTARNSLALGSVFNFAEYYGAESRGLVPFFWDNRASSVSEQATQTFANEREMGMSMHDVWSQVNALPYYAPLYKAAYGPHAITEAGILEALSEFVNSMASVNSRFDKVLDATIAAQSTSVNNAIEKDFIGFSPMENLGKRIYMSKCSSCHGRVIFAPARIAENNGLRLDYQDDQGVGTITGKFQDLGLFKVPTLRGVMLTAPYMHDGSIATIEEVIEHYSTGIKNHSNLSYELKSNGSPKRFDFIPEEKAALIAFFKTLTDEQIQKDERYADPFK